MAIGVAVLVIGVLIAAIWVIIEVKRLKHKLFAVFLIVFILFAYVSFTLSLRGQDIDIKTVPGIIEASKLYYSWLVSLFVNMQSITANAIKMDWSINKTSVR